jgi:hypothetical protein
MLLAKIVVDAIWIGAIVRDRRISRKIHTASGAKSQACNSGQTKEG